MKLPEGATTVWVWSEERGPGLDDVYLAICDDDGDPVDEHLLIWSYLPDDTHIAYAKGEYYAQRYGLEFITDDLATEHLTIAMAGY